MKTLPLLVAAATLSLTALSATIAPSSARAQAMDKPMVMPSDTTGKPMMVMPAKASATDMWKAAWAYRNLDDHEVKRYKAMGLSDYTIRGAANIALRTGEDMEYVVRKVKEVGIPLAVLAAEDGLSTNQVTAEIPGYGLEYMAIMSTPMTPPSMPAMAPMRSGMIDSTNGTSTTAMNSDTTASSSSAVLPAPPVTPNLTAPAAQNTVVEVILGNPDFSTLVSALKAADLIDMLQGPGPFTIFAPNNAAFAKLPTGTVDVWMKPENKDKLRAALQYHVIPGKIMAADIMAMSNPSTPLTASGSTLNVKTTAPIMVNNANVISTDMVASNGVIHVVDTVLMPPSADTATSPSPAP